MQVIIFRNKYNMQPTGETFPIQIHSKVNIIPKKYMQYSHPPAQTGKTKYSRLV